MRRTGDSAHARAILLHSFALTEKSCRSTFSTVLNFRPGSIRGWRRVFGHIAPIFIERGIANMETKEMSSLSVEPAEETAQMRVSVFEVSCSLKHKLRFFAVLF